MKLSVVEYYLVLPWRHDCTADGHFLNLKAIRWLLVVFADLLVEVQVFFALDWSETRILDRFDAVQPFD